MHFGYIPEEEAHRRLAVERLVLDTAHFRRKLLHESFMDATRKKEAEASDGRTLLSCGNYDHTLRGKRDEPLLDMCNM